MSLKRLVNDKDIYDSLVEELDRRLSAVHKSFHSARDSEELFRLQGEARALLRLKELREKVNNG